LRRIAAGLGLSYEALTGDLSETNFSSGRMGWLEMQRTIEHSRWHVHIPQFCDGIAAWWAERAVQAGIDARETTWRWTPPRREVVDPSREYPAMRDAMRAGIFALPEVHRSLGYETADVLAEIDATNKELDRLGIKIDSDARNTQSQAPSAPTA
jgi:capsid protein